MDEDLRKSLRQAKTTQNELDIQKYLKDLERATGRRCPHPPRAHLPPSPDQNYYDSRAILYRCPNCGADAGTPCDLTYWDGASVPGRDGNGRVVVSCAARREEVSAADFWCDLSRRRNPLTKYRRNSDQSTREAQRLASQGDTHALAKYIAAKMRQGEVPHSFIVFAAELGHPVAQLLYPDAQTIPYERLNVIFEELIREGHLPLIVRIIISMLPGDDPRYAACIEAALRWTRSPSPELVPEGGLDIDGPCTTIDYQDHSHDAVITRDAKYAIFSIINHAKDGKGQGMEYHNGYTAAYILKKLATPPGAFPLAMLEENIATQQQRNHIAEVLLGLRAIA